MTAAITCPAHYFYSRIGTKSKGENIETETWFSKLLLMV
jgi:hypothetical protein